MEIANVNEPSQEAKRNQKKSNEILRFYCKRKKTRKKKYQRDKFKGEFIQTKYIFISYIPHALEHIYLIGYNDHNLCKAIKRKRVSALCVRSFKYNSVEFKYLVIKIR